MKSNPTVCILMSTYNGEKYLREQMESIFSQKDVNIKLIVRDDGSTDNTLEILNEYPNIELIKGQNIGCEESFKELLYLPRDAEYYAFADQDDVWHPHKLLSAINNIKEFGADLSVCNLMIADENMKLKEAMFDSNELEHLDHMFRHHILGNLHGCTQVWTKKLHKILQSYYISFPVVHDVWVNTLANMISSTYIDPNCYINYRIHGNNSSGKAKNIFHKIIRGFTKYIIPQKPTNNVLCNQLIIGYGKNVNLSERRYEYIKLISNYNNNLKIKLRLLFYKTMYEYSFLRRALIRICILINKF